VEEVPSRKLAVILHADVVGSTALVRLDEALAHQRIRDVFQRFSETIAEHGGMAREVRGDALVAEFAKASDAVAAALDFQAANAAHNQALTGEVRPMLRVGIAMGEVVVANNTVTGEGVVLAQRLEQLAEPGGVCIQDAVYQTVPKRLPYRYESLGERDVKGFDEPVRIFSVRPRPEVEASEPGKEATQGSTTPPLPDKPSIAVLPFTNMSGDPEQAYFSDGVTEDIITELSRFRELFVIARNSTFVFKGQAVEVREVARRLGVRYVVEGSVRKAGNRVRITAQLVDAATGNHVWAERYDRELEDVFAVQDEVVRAIAGTLPGQIRHAELGLAKRRPSVEAYDLVLRAYALFQESTRESTLEARVLLEQAIAIAPDYALAHTLLSAVHSNNWDEGWWGDSAEESRRLHLEHARLAVKLDELDSRCQHIISDACFWCLGDLELALIHAERAVELNPNDCGSAAWLGFLHARLGEHEKGLAVCEQALRLDPLSGTWPRHLLGLAQLHSGRYEQALTTLKEAGWRTRDLWMAVALVRLGRVGEARELVRRHIERWRERTTRLPENLVEFLISRWGPYERDERERLAKDLQTAGVPGALQ
jgi:adenylate cyclase